MTHDVEHRFIYWVDQKVYLYFSISCYKTPDELFGHPISFLMGFPGSSAGKESACNTGDPSLIPRLGRSFGEGMDYPLQYPWASLVASMVKNPPAMWETWV